MKVDLEVKPDRVPTGTFKTEPGFRVHVSIVFSEEEKAAFKTFGYEDKILFYNYQLGDILANRTQLLIYAQLEVHAKTMLQKIKQELITFKEALSEDMKKLDYPLKESFEV